MEKEKFTLTLEAVKNCIGFDPNSGLYQTLTGMCDSWYAIEKKNGASDEAAAIVALNNLSATLLKMSNPA